MYAQQNTNIFPAIYVCPNVAEYSENPFDCALRGPFAKQFLTRLSATRALCIVLIDVISASTVYDITVYHQNQQMSIDFLKFFRIFSDTSYSDESAFLLSGVSIDK